MRISDSLVIELLHKSHKVSPEQIGNLINQQHTENKPLIEIVQSSELLDEKEFTKLYADKIDVPFVELVPTNLRKEILRLIPGTYCTPV